MCGVKDCDGALAVKDRFDLKRSSLRGKLKRVAFHMGGVKDYDESLARESVADDFVDLFLDEGEEGEVGYACQLLSVSSDIGLTDLSWTTSFS